MDEIERGRARRLKLLGNRAKENPFRLGVERVFWDRDFLHFYIDVCDDLFFENPHRALDVALPFLEASRQTRDKHCIARALALKGSAFRAMNLCEAAQEFFDSAIEKAGGCPCCLGDIYRRRGISWVEQSPGKAFEDFKCAMAHYRVQGDGDGVARVLAARGVLHFKRCDNRRAIDDERRALEMLSIDSPVVYHTGALLNMAYFLVTGTSDDFREAEGHLREFEERLKGRSIPKILRIKVKWIGCGSFRTA